MSDLEIPDFIELYKSYLATFNTHNLDATLSYLSPTCTLISYHLPGRHQNLEEMKSSFVKDFLSRTMPVSLGAITEISRSDVGVLGRRGVQVELIDAEHNRSLTVNYWYAQDNDAVWRQVLHEILLVSDLEEKS